MQSNMIFPDKLSLKIKCCVDRLRPPPINGHSETPSACLKGANNRLMHCSKTLSILASL